MQNKANADKETTTTKISKLIQGNGKHNIKRKRQTNNNKQTKSQKETQNTTTNINSKIITANEKIK